VVGTRTQRRKKMLLEDKYAVIYGGGGSIGGAVARAFAREGDFTAVRTTFLTSRAAARHMIRQGSGVILAFGGSGDPIRDYYIGGTQVAFEAIEAMPPQLASELGPHGVRVD
jgi:NAD(P)-dependent dehydrogenase (short-subunit alcohol dehydrogenase family)